MIDKRLFLPATSLRESRDSIQRVPAWAVSPRTVDIDPMMNLGIYVVLLLWLAFGVRMVVRYEPWCRPRRDASAKVRAAWSFGLVIAGWVGGFALMLYYLFFN